MSEHLTTITNSTANPTPDAQYIEHHVTLVNPQAGLNEQDGLYRERAWVAYQRTKAIRERLKKSGTGVDQMAQEMRKPSELEIEFSRDVARIVRERREKRVRKA